MIVYKHMIIFKNLKWNLPSSLEESFSSEEKSISENKLFKTKKNELHNDEVNHQYHS